LSYKKENAAHDKIWVRNKYYVVKVTVYYSIVVNLWLCAQNYFVKRSCKSLPAHRVEEAKISFVPQESELNK
jgi:hypothetical protein